MLSYFLSWAEVTQAVKFTVLHERPAFDSRQIYRLLFLLPCLQRTWDITQLPMQCVPGAAALTVKWTERKGDLSVSVFVMPVRRMHRNLPPGRR